MHLCAANVFLYVCMQCFFVCLCTSLQQSCLTYQMCVHNILLIQLDYADNVTVKWLLIITFLLACLKPKKGRHSHSWIPFLHRVKAQSHQPKKFAWCFCIEINFDTAVLSYRLDRAILWGNSENRRFRKLGKQRLAVSHDRQVLTTSPSLQHYFFFFCCFF